MRKLLCIILLTLCGIGGAWGQRSDFRRGNREFRSGEFDKADISYRKGLLKDSTSVAGRYNLANNLYRQGNMDEAAKQMDSVPEDSVLRYNFAPAFFYNRGNIAIAQQDWNKAVDCYIKCLQLTPDDIDAKENYTYARYHIQNQDQDQNQDQNKDKDQKDNDDQNQNQQQNQNQNQDRQQDKNDSAGEKKRPVELSPQQAQQLLQAIQEKEKQTQEKVDAEKAAALKSRQKEKNW
ncbi:MAG: tetratricopeptide repeat protein [Bacteroidales bacterium]|nr:tetratricopeptide repeat protein [Bacteroidales bacterium]